MRTLLALLLAPGVLSAAPFDDYHNFVLINAAEDGKLQAIDALTPELIREHDAVLPDTRGAFVVVQTNDGRRAKLLVENARVKAADGTQVPLVLVSRFVTFREGTERAVHNSGQNVQVHAGLRFHVDLGQVVPASVGGDLEVVPDPQSPRRLLLKPVGRAKLFLLTAPLPGVGPPKSDRPMITADAFDPKFVNGTYHLFDDGRKSGKLTLSVDEAGVLSGHYLSDRDQEKYDVSGKLGNPKHALTFTIKFPRVEQAFTGHLFTGDGKAIAGTSNLQGRPAGFYAVRE